MAIREQFRFSPDSPLVFHPRFTNLEKTKIKTIVRLPDGRLTEMETDRDDLKSALRRDIFSQYTEEEILYFTRRHELMVAARQEADRRIAEDKQTFQAQEEMYKVKEEAAQLLASVLPEDKDLLKRVRAARTKTEVLALAVRAVMKAEEKG